MIVKCIEGATAFLGAPRNWDPEKDGICGVLPVLQIECDGKPAFVSAWEPTPKELELMWHGAAVYLRVIGSGHPPVWLWVGESPHPDRDQLVDAMAHLQTGLELAKAVPHPSPAVLHLQQSAQRVYELLGGATLQDPFPSARERGTAPPPSDGG